jgi:hypothetical protein
MLKEGVLTQCEHCAHQFPSAYQFQPLETFRSLTIGSNSEQCPKCRKVTTADRAHMAYQLHDGNVVEYGGMFTTKLS